MKQGQAGGDGGDEDLLRRRLSFSSLTEELERQEHSGAFPALSLINSDLLRVF